MANQVIRETPRMESGVTPSMRQEIMTSKTYYLQKVFCADNGVAGVF